MNTLKAIIEAGRDGEIAGFLANKKAESLMGVITPLPDEGKLIIKYGLENRRGDRMPVRHSLPKVVAAWQRGWRKGYYRRGKAAKELERISEKHRSRVAAARLARMRKGYERKRFWECATCHAMSHVKFERCRCGAWDLARHPNKAKDLGAG